MEKRNIIYSDDFYKVVQCQEFPYIPGFYTILENQQKWYSSDESINRLAILEKIIRDVLLSIGVELVGIYREECDNGFFRVLLIPYYIDELKRNNISPDLYQPYISKYLNSFDKSYMEQVKSTDNIMIKKLKKGCVER